jgi:hypothetical protein
MEQVPGVKRGFFLRFTGNALSGDSRNILLMWLAWAAILLCFQGFVVARFRPQYPDTVLSWTASDQQALFSGEKPLLASPVLNAQAAYDSEFYLSIATYGYDDPNMRTSPPAGQNAIGLEPVSLNYAFLPLYPFLMRIVGLLFRPFGATPVAASAIAGVILSLLGCLAALYALFDMAKRRYPDDRALYAPFFLLIFPTGFFLAQIYTEGLFLGLAFSSLALIERRKWLPAAILAAFAVWTRAVGVCLCLPLALAWIMDAPWSDFKLKPFPKKLALSGLCCVLPGLSYIAWRLFFGAKFDFIERSFFGRSLLNPESFTAWFNALANVFRGGNPRMAVYHLVEAGIVILAFAATIKDLRKHPEIFIFGIAALLIAFMSGDATNAQSMSRYALAAPSIYLALAGIAKRPVLGKAWMMASTMLMAIMAALYSFDFWVA